MDWLYRQRMILGDEATDELAKKTVMLFGVGGVGGFALEAVVRAGVGRVVLIDCDSVSLTNINRQIIADTSTVGRLKTEVARERCLRINPEIRVDVYDAFANSENIPEMIVRSSPDYIIDAIDTVSSKLIIIKEAYERAIPVISSMGTGSKLDPTRFKIVDITKTHTCPLAKVMRLKLREMGIAHCKVLFSDEPPVKATMESEVAGETTRHVPGSVSFVPSAAGLIIGGHVVRELCGK